MLKSRGKQQKTKTVRKMNTTENNKNLAEFLGILTTDAYGVIREDIEKFKFHNNWNWLMQVVEKIEETEAKDGRTFTIDMHKDNVIINQYGKYNHEIIVTEGGTRFENTYKACVEFVEWWDKKQFDKE